ncbi:MAG: cytochrome-c peroxidase [Bacteroidia bacterium]
MLFFDPILSKDNSVSCSSCHKPELAYTDGMPRALVFVARYITTKYTYLAECSITTQSFHDARALVLEDQAKTVVQNEREMHGDFGEVVKKVAAV